MNIQKFSHNECSSSAFYWHSKNRLVALHSALVKAHEEAGRLYSPRSVIYRLV